MKSSISKRFFLVFIIFLITVFYFSCDDAGIVEPENQELCITGQIVNWTQGTKTLHAYVRSSSGPSFSIANCPIDAGGNFNVCLPATLSDSTLFSSDSIFYIGCTGGGTVTFNPPDGRGTEIISFRVKNGDTTIGYIRRNNYDTLYPGAFSIMYVYANKDVTVSGYKICTNDTLHFDGTAKKGWTKVVKNRLRVTGPGTTYLYNTTEPPGAIWEFY